MIESDDFAPGSLDPVWSINGPAGTSADLASNATDGYLELVTPDGDYDVWDANNGARVMQAADDVDFQIETRFLITPLQLASATAVLANRGTYIQPRMVEAIQLPGDGRADAAAAYDAWRAVVDHDGA